MKKGVREFVGSCINRFEEAEVKVTSKSDQCRERKFPDGVLKRREQAQLLGIPNLEDKQDPSTHTTE